MQTSKVCTMQALCARQTTLCALCCSRQCYKGRHALCSVHNVWGHLGLLLLIVHQIFDMSLKVNTRTEQLCIVQLLKNKYHQRWKMVILPGFSGKWTPFIQYLVLLLSSRLVRWGTRLGVDSTWHPEESVEMNNPEWFSERDQEGSPLSVTSSGDKMRLGRAKQMQMSPTIRELHSPDSIFWLLSTPPLLGSEETKNRGPLRRRWLMTQATHSFLTKNPIQIGELETWARGGDWNLSYNICFLGNIWACKHFITIGNQLD